MSNLCISKPISAEDLRLNDDCRGFSLLAGFYDRDIDLLCRRARLYEKCGLKSFQETLYDDSITINTRIVYDQTLKNEYAVKVTIAKGSKSYDALVELEPQEVKIIEKYMTVVTTNKPAVTLEKTIKRLENMGINPRSGAICDKRDRLL